MYICIEGRRKQEQFHFTVLRTEGHTHTFYFRVNKAKKRINFSVNKAEYIIRTLYFNFAFKIANENSVCF